MNHEVKTAFQDKLQDKAASLGFEEVRYVHPDSIGHAAKRINEFISAGYHGDMDWLAATALRRQNPRALMPNVKTILMLGMNYGPASDPLVELKKRNNGVISVYAKGKDYHDVIKGKLKQLAQWMASRRNVDVKVFVDTAALMEKPLAQEAGLGWQGKHTNLVSRRHGSWLFLGAILTTLELKPDPPEIDHCGNCRACLDICPTDAFPAPYQLDARRCISYLTIEHKGHIAEEFRRPMGNRIFGCDDCLAVCPWNKFASTCRETKFSARVDTDNPPLADLLTLDDSNFRSRFAGTSIKRTGRNRFIRNVLIAAGNSGDKSLVPTVANLLSDTSPLVRAMAVWALAQLQPAEQFQKARKIHMSQERDAGVIAEWTRKDKQ